MAGCFYNGVLLPEIPSDALKNYPYCWIRNNTRTGYYDLMMAKSPWWQSDSTTIYTASYADGIQWYRTPMTKVGDDWTFHQSWTTNGGFADESDRNIIWANQNIPAGAVTATTIYFVGSSAVPDVESYQIKKDTVVAIADQVRRLCKTEDTMTPAVIENKLGGLNIELMETYVISDSTEQVIYPDEGYYGFSKITVGAVDLSGGGGGGSGDGEGEEGEEIPDGEDVDFGTITPGKDLYTGKYFYGNYPDAISPIPAIPDDYPYAYFCEEGSFDPETGEYAFTLYFVSSPLWISDYYGKVAPRPSPSPYISYRYNPDTDTWNYYKEGGMNYIVDRRQLWSNHNIVRSDDSVYCKATAPIAETVEGVDTDTLDRENQYLVSGSTLNALGAVVQQITGISATTLEGMIYALQMYAATH